MGRSLGGYASTDRMPVSACRRPPRAGTAPLTIGARRAVARTGPMVSVGGRLGSETSVRCLISAPAGQVLGEVQGCTCWSPASAVTTVGRPRASSRREPDRTPTGPPLDLLAADSHPYVHDLRPGICHPAAPESAGLVPPRALPRGPAATRPNQASLPQPSVRPRAPPRLFLQSWAGVATPRCPTQTPTPALAPAPASGAGTRIPGEVATWRVLAASTGRRHGPTFEGYASPNVSAGSVASRSLNSSAPRCPPS